jgi:Bacterial Ig domain
VAGGLLLLIGVGVVFAGNAMNGNRAGNARSAQPEATSHSPPPSAMAPPDTKPPSIHVSRPDPGSVVYGATETLRGRTEAGATLTLTDETLGSQVDATVERDGSFEAELSLQVGENTFTLSAEDAAGNKASTRLVVTRGTSLGSVALTLSAADVDLSDLTTTVNATAVVHDENGGLSNGANATFSLSPPNGSTQTYVTTITNGEARWTGMVVSGDRRAAGKWLVTILVTLPGGEELRDDAFFTVR